MLEFIGTPATAPSLDALFKALNTARRPQLDANDLEDGRYCDWVLVRRKGVELGFCDAAWHQGEPAYRWGHSGLILTQVYFYAGFDEVAAYTGNLPYSLRLDDTRAQVRAKLAAFESSRHSYQADTWDVDGYRLTVAYQDSHDAIRCVLCQRPPQPWQHPPEPVMADLPSPRAIVDAFGQSLSSDRLHALWPGVLTPERVQDLANDRELDLTQSLGVELYAVPWRELKLRQLAVASPREPVFAAVKFLTEREREAHGWRGELPLGLRFEDSPEDLRRKVPLPPERQYDDAYTGFCLWHLARVSLHVLYSTIDNRLLRVLIMAPGYWQDLEPL